MNFRISNLRLEIFQDPHKIYDGVSPALSWAYTRRKIFSGYKFFFGFELSPKKIIAC